MADDAPVDPSVVYNNQAEEYTLPLQNNINLQMEVHNVIYTT